MLVLQTKRFLPRSSFERTALTELFAFNLPVIPTKGEIGSSKRFLIHENHFLFDRNNSCFSIPAGSRPMIVSSCKPRATLPTVVLPRAKICRPFRPFSVIPTKEGSVHRRDFSFMKIISFSTATTPAFQFQPVRGR